MTRGRLNIRYFVRDEGEDTGFLINQENQSILSVTCFSAGDRAGLVVGDTIIQINEMSWNEGGKRLLDKNPPGYALKIKVKSKERIMDWKERRRRFASKVLSGMGSKPNYAGLGRAILKYETDKPQLDSIAPKIGSTEPRVKMSFTIKQKDSSDAGSFDIDSNGLSRIIQTNEMLNDSGLYLACALKVQSISLSLVQLLPLFYPKRDPKPYRFNKNSAVILLPTFTSMHWYLLVFIRRDKKLFVFDSLPQKTMKLRERTKQVQGLIKRVFSGDITIVSLNVETQGANSNDCGIYVLCYIDIVKRWIEAGMKSDLVNLAEKTQLNISRAAVLKEIVEYINIPRLSVM